MAVENLRYFSEHIDRSDYLNMHINQICWENVLFFPDNVASTSVIAIVMGSLSATLIVVVSVIGALVFLRKRGLRNKG